MSKSDVVTISTDNRGPLVNLASRILLTSMCLLTITKVSSKWLLIHKLQPDDWYMVAGMVCWKVLRCQNVNNKADEWKDYYGRL